MDGTHDKNGVIAPQQASSSRTSTDASANKDPLSDPDPVQPRRPALGHRTLHLVNPDRYVVELARRSPRTRPRPGRGMME